MKAELTPEIIWSGFIVFGLCVTIMFVLGLAKGVSIGRDKDRKTAERMAAHFAEWCDDHVSQTRDRSGLWYGVKLGIDRHKALPTTEILKIFKRRFPKYD